MEKLLKYMELHKNDENGYLLLSVGPCADGSFHPDAVRILEEIGCWLSVNGEAIYGTRPWTVAGEGSTAGAASDAAGDEQKIEDTSQEFSKEDFRFTQKDNRLYDRM